MNELRIFDSLSFQNENYPQEACISQLSSGTVNSLSTQQVVDKINRVSAGLLAAGFKPGDKFSISAYNSTTWAIVDLAASQIGMINVPLYPNASEEDYQFILSQAEVKVVFAGDAEIAKKLKNAASKLHINHYNLFKDNPESFWEILSIEYTSEVLAKIDEIKNTITPDSLATIIYTSGTTGEPKGVMLSHTNIMSNAKDVAAAIGLPGKKYKVLSFLPLSHIFERTALYTYLFTGMSIYYPENLDNLGEDLKLVKPHFFTTVPRVLEKIFEKIQAKAAALSPVKRAIFKWSMNKAKKFEPGRQMGFIERAEKNLADKFVFSKWREAVGGNIQFIVSGAAALQPELVSIFTSAGIPILEAYGLTEASPGVTMTRFELDNIKAGSVGKVIDSVEIKINKDSEVLVKGPNVMVGYYQRPEATGDVIKNGWLHTGDLGMIDEKGNLFITGRKKELFKTSGGKYIAPQKIENLLKTSMFIDQVVVIGEDKKYPAALIVPSFEFLINELPQAQNQNLQEQPEVRGLFKKIIDDINEELGRYEQIKKFYLLDSAWTVESGELTPTLKVKRKVIMERYSKEIASLF